MKFVEQCDQQHVSEKGPKKFGKKGEEAALKEVRQLHNRRCFEPTAGKELMPEERMKAQRALPHLCEKRDGAIKGRCVCNGKPTREWLGREETASPTAATESIH